MDRKRKHDAPVKLSPGLLSIINTESNAIQSNDIEPNVHNVVNQKIIKIEHKYVDELNSYLTAACMRMNIT
jgi:hypothetical protein